MVLLQFAFVSRTSSTASNSTSQYYSSFASLNATRSLGAFGFLNFAMISHRRASVKRVASSFICLLLRFTESKSPESHMSKVHTHHLSPHHELWLKVRSYAGDYYMHGKCIIEHTNGPQQDLPYVYIIVCKRKTILSILMPTIICAHCYNLINRCVA